MLENLRDNAKFLCKIVPAFLRQAAKIQPDLQFLQVKSMQNSLLVETRGPHAGRHLPKLRDASWVGGRASQRIHEHAVRCGEGAATVLGMANRQAGVDSVVVQVKLIMGFGLRILGRSFEIEVAGILHQEPWLSGTLLRPAREADDKQHTSGSHVLY